LGLTYEGPGIAKIEVPAAAYSRVPAGNEPTIALTAPANQATIPNANPGFSATVALNGATLNSVRYYSLIFIPITPAPVRAWITISVKVSQLSRQRARLENAIERAVALGAENKLRLQELPEGFRDAGSRVAGDSSGALPSLEAQEAEYIRWV